MSVLRVPVLAARRIASVSSISTVSPKSSRPRRISPLISSTRDLSTTDSESPAEPIVEVASDNLIREAVAAVKAAKAGETQVEAEAALPPIDSYPENYQLEGLEYTGRANVAYDDAFILYKLEVDMEKMRMEQPCPSVPDKDRMKI